MKGRWAGTALGYTLLTFSVAATAQTSEPVRIADDNDVIVTASRARADVAPDVIYVDQDRIERLDAPSSLAALDGVPGVLAYARGGIGGPSYLSIRGAEPNFTLVLLEGVPINDPTNSQGGSFDFSQLDPALLGAIEVGRRGASAVHGANALSGVVHLRLLRPRSDDPAIRTAVRGDSSGGLAANVTAASGKDSGSVLLHAAVLDTSEVRSSRIERSQALLNLEGSRGPLDVTAFAMHTRTERTAFPEESGGLRRAVNRERERRSVRFSAASATLRMRDLARGFDLSGQTSWSRQESKSITPAIASGVFDGVPALTSDTRYERLDLTGFGRMQRGPVTAIAGLTWTHEVGRDRGTIDLGVIVPTRFRRERRTTGLFSEIEFARSPVQLTLSLRSDLSSDRSPQWTGRLGGELSLDQVTRLSGSFGTSYKPPSIYALDQPLVGNPDLQPERARTIDLGIERQAANGISLTATLFQTRYRQLIDFDPELFRLVNRSRVTVSGVELLVRAQPTSRVDVIASITRLWYKTSIALRGRPDVKATAELDWRVATDASVFGRMIFNGEVLDSSVPTGLVRLPKRLSLTVGGNLALSKRIKVRATVTNALGSDAETAVGFPAEGRTVRLSLVSAF